MARNCQSAAVLSRSEAGREATLQDSCRHTWPPDLWAHWQSEICSRQSLRSSAYGHQCQQPAFEAQALQARRPSSFGTSAPRLLLEPPLCPQRRLTGASPAQEASHLSPGGRRSQCPTLMRRAACFGPLQGTDRWLVSLRSKVAVKVRLSPASPCL